MGPSQGFEEWVITQTTATQKRHLGPEAVDDIRRSIQNVFVPGNTQFREQVERIIETPLAYQSPIIRTLLAEGDACIFSPRLLQTTRTETFSVSAINNS